MGDLADMATAISERERADLVAVMVEKHRRREARRPPAPPREDNHQGDKACSTNC